jgi:hypothetical protein
MTTSNLQHNSPKRGWVPCKATKRACRYGGDQHRTVQVSSNLESHSAEIQKSASDGVIDAQETKDLSQNIADSILSPKKEKVWREVTNEKPVTFDSVETPFTKAVIPPSIPVVEENYKSSYEVAAARTNLNRSINELNHYAPKKAEFINRAENRIRANQKALDRYYTEENFEKLYSAKEFNVKKFSKEEIKESFDLDATLLRREITSKKKQISTYDERMKPTEELYLKYKATYEAALVKEEEEEKKTVRLDRTNQEYFKTTHAIGGKLDIPEYNSMVDALKKDPDMSMEDKIRGVHGLRAELIETAKVNYRSSKRSQFLDTIGNLFARRDERLTDEERDAQNKAIDLNHAEDGVKLAKFSQNLKKAPWDAKIKD